MPGIDNDGALVRQSASELVLEVDESGSQAFRPLAAGPTSKQMLGSFNFGHHEAPLRAPIVQEEQARKQACLSQLNSLVEQDLKSDLLVGEDSNNPVEGKDH